LSDGVRLVRLLKHRSRAVRTGSASQPIATAVSAARGAD
jgi:hypothetical protein